MNAPANVVSPLPLSLDAMPITISHFEDVTADPQKMTTTWAHIAETLANPSAHAAKSSCHLLNLATFGSKRTPKPGGSAGSLRNNDNVTSLCGVMADYDGEVVSFDEAVARLKSVYIEAVVYTSPSHSPNKPRWRVVAPFRSPRKPEEYSKFADLLNGALGGVLGAETWDTSRCFYYGRVNDDYKCERINTGVCLDDEFVAMIGNAPIARPGGLSKALPQEPSEFADLVRRQKIASATAETMEDLALALHFLAQNTRYAIDRDTWIKTGQALASLKNGRFEQQAFELWDRFSKTNPEAQYNADDMSGRWAGLNPNRITFASVFQWAQLAGWKNPRKLTPFASPFEPHQKRLFLEWFENVEPTLESMTLVDGYLGEGDMSVVYGESGCGKTFYTMDIGFHIALGRQWRGRDVKQGTVVYIAAEAGKGARKRIDAFRKHHALQGKRVPFALVPCPVNLRDKAADTQEVINLIRQAEMECGRVRLVVVDTLSRAFAGGKENTSEDMTAFVENIDRIRAETSAHVAIVHHSGKNKVMGARGHSSLRAATDTEIEIANHVAENKKQRDEGMAEPVSFALEVVKLGELKNGKSITSCVVVEPSETSGTPQSRREKAILDVFRSTADGGRAPRTKAEIWTLLREKDSAFGANPRQERSRTLERLVGQGKILESGKGRNVRYKLAQPVAHKPTSNPFSSTEPELEEVAEG